MHQYLLLCRSLTYAQRASRTLEHAGITATITKVPKSVSGQGCGYCVKVSEKNLAKALSTLGNAGLDPSHVFLQEANGGFTEVNTP